MTKTDGPMAHTAMDRRSEIDVAVDRYRRFRELLEDVPRQPPAPYHDTFKGLTVDGSALALSWFASDALREIANSINDFRRYILHLRAWLPIYEQGSTTEKHDIVVEHIRPLAILCLGAPQALRGRLIHAATAASHHANTFHPDRRTLPKWDGGHTDMKIAKKICQCWHAWPDLASALSALGDQGFGEATSSFRNEHEHGHPRSIGIGETSFVRKVSPDDDTFPRMPGSSEVASGEVWSIGTHPALDLSYLLPLLDKQYGLALMAFDAFHELLVQQLAAAPKPFVSASGEKITFDVATPRASN